MLKVSYPEAKWMTNNRWTPNTHWFLHLFTQAGFWQLFPILPVNVILSMFSGQENWRWFLLVLELNLMFGLLAWYSVFLTLLQTWINPTIPSAPITLKALCIISPQPIRNKPVCTHIHTHSHILLSEASVVRRQGWSQEYSLTSEDLSGGEKEGESKEKKTKERGKGGK